MNHYITGVMIKQHREKNQLTQTQLGQKIGVSDKTVSKWENAKGLPDISLIEPLSKALGISVAELLAGKSIENENRGGNMLKSKLYVCPICGNVIHGMGENLINCCGIQLPVLDAEEPEEEDEIQIERLGSNYYISVKHAMTKEHYISFIAYVTSGEFHMKKLYPQGNAEAEFMITGHGIIYVYCNRHGLMKKKI